LVDVLGKFPLPVEVIPMAQAVVMRKLAAMGGTPTLRMKGETPLVTDNSCYIVDVGGLQMHDAAHFEQEINNIVGVVTVGLFARQAANVCLLGTADGVKTLQF